ncbi:SAM-dependent methyltransferase [Deferribacter autotrophicus]|uniref:SAM-dependent methyltransferase n=1 Tax=Deferribacter autotrophicus TaxID=500465 RepID=UPI00165E1016|nr:SAM-dependent methyltransferase [Deferribacter autotrophicus]
MATPLSQNYSEIPEYQISILKNVDLFIGEEKKFTVRLLAFLKMRDKPYLLINEHSVDDDYLVALDEIKKVESAVFFSDCGTPSVADPGYKLINMAYQNGVEVLSLPGPSSIMAALSVSGFYAERFYFAGFPPKKGYERKNFFKKLERFKETVVLMERPYACKRVLDELQYLKKRISISFNLGMPDEKTFRGFPKDVSKMLNDVKKAPFVIVMEGIKK